jgi:hypothetical protein
MEMHELPACKCGRAMALVYSIAGKQEICPKCHPRKFRALFNAMEKKEK